MSLRFDEIADILKIIDASSCDEVVIETGDVKLVVRRNHHGNGALAPAASAQPTWPSASSSPRVGTAPAQPTSAQPTQSRPGQIEITAPMVGTFYRASSPEATPFVEIGSEVRKGAPLCLIEVMKLFTTIYAEHEGRVVEIGAQNGELVEYGRALFVLDPL
jgi:acetyl-CoA carboxylase biotin carboxyl carrier protein